MRNLRLSTCLPCCYFPFLFFYIYLYDCMTLNHCTKTLYLSTYLLKETRWVYSSFNDKPTSNGMYYVQLQPNKKKIKKRHTYTIYTHINREIEWWTSHAILPTHTCLLTHLLKKWNLRIYEEWMMRKHF